MLSEGLSSFVREFKAESMKPPAIDRILSDKEKNDKVKVLQDKDEVVVVNRRCLVRTTKEGIEKSRRDWEESANLSSDDDIRIINSSDDEEDIRIVDEGEDEINIIESEDEVIIIEEGDDVINIIEEGEEEINIIEVGGEEINIIEEGDEEINTMEEGDDEVIR